MLLSLVKKMGEDPGVNSGVSLAAVALIASLHPTARV